jgi:hypothetical protein
MGTQLRKWAWTREREMKNLRHATIGIVAGGLLSLGGVSVVTAQTDTTTRIDIGTVTQELNLNEATSRELAPLLERLNVVFGHQERHWQEGDEIWEEIAVTYDQIAETLSATELQEFHWLLQGTAAGTWDGRPMRGSMMGRGRVGATGGRGIAMRGGRGPCGRGMYMRGGSGYAGQGVPMRGTRGYAGRGARPGWRFDDIDPNN